MKYKAIFEYLNPLNQVTISRSDVRSIVIQSELVFYNYSDNDELKTAWSEVTNTALICINGEFYTFGLYYQDDQDDDLDRDSRSRIRIHETFVNDLDDGSTFVYLDKSTDLIGDCVNVINRLRTDHHNELS